MRSPPPEELVDLLARLGLALPGEVRGMRRRVRRLARDLPAFESVWVDALAQARKLTPFQTAQINAGRGESLAVGPYVLQAPLPGPAYATTYRARQRDGTSAVRLTIFPLGAHDAAAVLAAAKALIRQTATLAEPSIVAIQDCGLHGDKLWVASKAIYDIGHGATAQDWMVCNGRFPPPAVLEIARQMIAGLAACERAGIVHGDLAAGQVLLDQPGQVRLAAPGLRAIVRPTEGFANSDHDPFVFDGLAPERIRDGAPPTLASELFACGCLWWHLLTGRVPLVGATGLAKMQSALAARIPDVRTLAPDAPPVLAEAIADCVKHDPSARPPSFAALAQRLGPATQQGQALLNRCLAEDAPPVALRGVRARRMRPARPVRPARGVPLPAVAVIGAALVLAVATWPLWKQQPIDEARPTAQAIPAPEASAVNMARRPQGLPQRTAADRTAGPLAAPPMLSMDKKPNSSSTRNPTRGTAPRGPIALSSAEQPLESTSADGQTGGVNNGVETLVLPAGRGVAWTAVRLQPGQIVCSPAGKRATVFVSGSGAVVDVEGVQFRDVDFVYTAARGSAGRDGSRHDPREMAGIIDLRASQCALSGCTFRSEPAVGELPAAVVWRTPATTPARRDGRRGDHLQLVDCAVAGVDSGVRFEGEVGATVELTNVVHLGPGPLVLLDRWPAAQQVLSVHLQQSTLRDAAGLLECSFDTPVANIGKIAIRADRCALAPGDGHGLAILLGDDDPTRFLSAIELSGEGTVVTQDMPLVEWQGMDGRRRVARGIEPRGKGLVRCELEFAAPADEGPGASRLVGWQAPLKSPQPPGIGEIPLVRPVRNGK